MMVLCPKAGSLAFTPPGDEMREVLSCCHTHRKLWVSNLSKVATQLLEVDIEPATLQLQSTQHTPTSLHPILYGLTIQKSRTYVYQQTVQETVTIASSTLCEKAQQFFILKHDQNRSVARDHSV